jgi:hypothetical protein
MNTPDLPASWTAICDCSLCERVHREWCIRFRMPAVNFLTDEVGPQMLGLMVNTDRAAFEALVRDLIASVVSRQ